ncbi:hypothetical protein CLU79DRAFT_718342 [Phycomyces nitens]|nr:hypothetical protein CLU79DRAFT_718342 [Phycomyces nitens]
MHSLGPSKQHTYWSRRPEAIFRMNVYEDKPSGPLSTLPIVRQVSQHIQQLEDLSIGYKDIMPEWVPSSKRLDNGEVCMDFKGTSYRSIGHLPGYSQLHPREVLLVSSLCMKPKQYLVSKKNIIMAAEESYKERLPFRPKQVQTLCHLDDAKASFLYHVFWNLGWLEPKDKSRATLEAAE